MQLKMASGKKKNANQQQNYLPLHAFSVATPLYYK
jgi:hypothetical protein